MLCPGTGDLNMQDALSGTAKRRPELSMEKPWAHRRQGHVRFLASLLLLLVLLLSPRIGLLVRLPSAEDARKMHQRTGT